MATWCLGHILEDHGVSLFLDTYKLCVVVIQNVNNSLYKTQSRDTYKNSDWMRDLSSGLQNISLKYLAIPGSHDTGTYSLHKDEIYSFKEKYSKLLNFVRNMSELRSVGQIIHRWSQTQSLNVSEQLKRGVRYLDIRVAVDNNGTGRIVHALLGSSLQDVLNQVNEFLEGHGHEVVLFDVTNVHHKNQSEEEKVEEEILKNIFHICGDKLCPRTLVDASLQQIWRHKCQLFVFYQNPSHISHKHYGDNLTYICSKEMIWSPFDSLIFTQYSKWLHFLDNTYTKPFTHFHVVQGIMQPHWMEIVVAGISDTATLKRWVSDRATRELVRWLHGKHNGRGGVNIVIADFVEDYEFVDTVISLNTVTDMSVTSTSIVLMDNMYCVLSVLLVIFILR